MTTPSLSPVPVARALLLFLLALPASGQNRFGPEADYEEGLKRYQTCMARLPFYFHTDGRARVATSRDQRALQILIKDYDKPKAYAEFSRYTIATLIGRYFDESEAVAPLQALRQKHGKPGDAWLWVRSLAIEIHQEDTAGAMEVARSKDSVLRAAAIQALAEQGGLDVLDIVSEVCTNLPKRAWERRILIGAMSSAILVNKDNIRGPKMKAAIRAYIGLLAKDVGLAHSAKMVIARYLSKTIGKDSLYTDPEPWLQLLARDYTPPKRSGHTVVKPRFFGIEAVGDRICYLVDMSNSMCKKIDPTLSRSGPVTGPKKKRKKRRRGVPPDESDIPWHLIKTRFDLAREHLKISIQRLGKDKRFCVVWFGDKSGMLKSTPGMVKASRGNVRKVIKELESIEPGAPTREAPDGVLRGRTNMHSGFLRSFALRARGFAPKHEYVDAKAMAEGCDTIFMLSDGAPSYDGFVIEDKDYGEGRVVRDQEYAEGAPRQPRLWYHGPYDQPHWLQEDLRRMNVFRKVQIHCVGIGEADINLLRSIAKSSMGEVYLVGAKAKQRGKNSRGR